MKNFFIHSSVDGRLGCFFVLAIVNSAIMNNIIHCLFSVLISSGYMPRSGIAGSYGEGNGNPLQYSGLENPMDGGAWRATVHGVTKSQTRLSDLPHMMVLFLVFFFLRNHHSVFYSSCINLHSH